MPTNPMSSDYAVQFTLWNNQRTQDAQNKVTHDAYIGAQNFWIEQETSRQDKGLPIDDRPIPVVPMQTIYNDDGSISHPPFSDLKITVLPPPASSTSGSLINTSPPKDRTDQILDNEVIILILLNEILGKLK